MKIGMEVAKGSFKQLSDKDLDNLQWAKDFMDRYEKKHAKR